MLPPYKGDGCPRTACPSLDLEWFPMEEEEEEEEEEAWKPCCCRPSTSHVGHPYLYLYLCYTCMQLTVYACVYCSIYSVALLKAVTSTKLSPSGRYALVGYGVRQAGLVLGHSRPDATCEVLSLIDHMSSVAVFCDEEDEVYLTLPHLTCRGADHCSSLML